MNEWVPLMKGGANNRRPVAVPPRFPELFVPERRRSDVLLVVGAPNSRIILDLGRDEDGLLAGLANEGNTWL